MPFHVFIPARYHSTRLPAKALANIDGLSMIQRVYQQAKKTQAESVVVATDDQRIYDHVTSFGGEVVMTDEKHQSGTDRIKQASDLRRLSDNEIVVNVQGDEPFISPKVINQVAQLLEQVESPMSTLCTPIREMYEVTDPNVVKAVFDSYRQAIYFSRAAIPFDRDQQVTETDNSYYRHLGIYGYRKHFLDVFSKLPISQLESIEKLEQLRVLENGYKIAIDIACEEPTSGVDTPEDLAKAIEYAKSLRT